MGGSSSLEGRVEICYSGVWGTVCDDLWGRAEAAVACRQLKYPTGNFHERKFVPRISNSSLIQGLLEPVQHLDRGVVPFSFRM